MTLLDQFENRLLICEEKIQGVENAIELMCSLLLRDGNITPHYVDAIKQGHQKIGAYYVLAPKIAMPHARPEEGVIRSGLQLTIFKQGVDLESTENGEVFLAITLAAEDSESHLQTIMSLAELFQNEEKIEALIQAENMDELKSLLEA